MIETVTFKYLNKHKTNPQQGGLTMTSKTELIGKTTIKNTGGSVFVRVPPDYLKHLNLNKDNLPTELKIGAAKGNHGLFIWLQESNQAPPE